MIIVIDPVHTTGNIFIKFIDCYLHTTSTFKAQSLSAKCIIFFGVPYHIVHITFIFQHILYKGVDQLLYLQFYVQLIPFNYKWM